MEPKSDYLRQLEVRVQSLEAENRELRAALSNSNARSRITLDKAIVSKPLQSGNPLDRVNKCNEQAEFASSLLTPEAKICLFRSRFTGRNDLYARRWESLDGKKKGYTPVCANEWRDGVCKKPTIRCHDCNHRAFKPVTDAVVREHLTGAQVVGLYALDTTCRCSFIVADFDHEGWEDDTKALVRTCRRLEIPALPEISRSGDGAHVWFFFDAPVAAVTALLITPFKYTLSTPRIRVNRLASREAALVVSVHAEFLQLPDDLMQQRS